MKTFALALALLLPASALADRVDVTNTSGFGTLIDSTSYSSPLATMAVTSAEYQSGSDYFYVYGFTFTSTAQGTSIPGLSVGEVDDDLAFGVVTGSTTLSASSIPSLMLSPSCYAGFAVWGNMVCMLGGTSLTPISGFTLVNTVTVYVESADAPGHQAGDYGVDITDSYGEIVPAQFGVNSILAPDPQMQIGGPGGGNPTNTPEPSVLLLFGSSLALLAFMRHRFISPQQSLRQFDRP